MTGTKRKLLSISAAGTWIMFSEFARNEFILKSIWNRHFEAAGLEFKTLPFNGILWLIWSFFLAYLVYKLLTRFSIIETVFISWLSSFVMMWIVIYNLQVLPVTILSAAVPLSLIEIVFSVFLITKVSGNNP